MAPWFRRQRRLRVSAPVESVHVKAAVERLRGNPNDLDALVTMGVWLLAQGQSGKALACIHLITKADPTYPGIWRLKARAFEAVGDHGNAAICRERGADPFS